MRFRLIYSTINYELVLWPSYEFVQWDNSLFKKCFKNEIKIFNRGTGN